MLRKKFERRVQLNNEYVTIFWDPAFEVYGIRYQMWTNPGVTLNFMVDIRYMPEDEYCACLDKWRYRPNFEVDEHCWLKTGIIQKVGMFCEEAFHGLG